MHLAYLDDSDTKAKSRKWQVVAAVIVEDKMFKFLEIAMSDLPAALMGADNIAKFEEFHACEIYGGHGPFFGIDQERRFESISKLLTILKMVDATVIYGAVDIDDLKNQIYGSADPVDVCFRQCVKGIEQWARVTVDGRISEDLEEADDRSNETLTKTVLDHLIDNLVILVVDECDPKVKSTLQKSFRGMRPKLSSSVSNCFHDDMYFGDSRYSIGIQLADLCAYFIARHLEADQEIEGFYEMFESQIFPRKIADDGAREVRPADAEDS